QARVAAGVDVNQVFNISNTGGVSTDMAKQIRDAMANNPSTISRFDAQLTQATNSGATDVSQAITDAISRVNFTDLARQFNSAQNDTQRNEISSVMDRYEQALRAEAGRSTNTTARDNELLKHQRAIDLARLQM
ncbi:hypothetical protein KKH24_03065, partial [Patescibacteria group bacterium]|nr:hypothetical protein [Patescibacteria group bacterium]